MELFIILILILLNGILSLSEIAIVSARKSRLETAAKRGDSNAQIALATATNPNRFLSTVQIGITLIGILTGIFSGETITKDLELKLASIHGLQDYAETIAVGLVVTALTFFSLVIGELVPKRIGLSNPELFAKWTARPMKWITTICHPFVSLLTFTSDILIRIFQIKPSSDSRVTEEEIKAIIQEGSEGGAIEEIEQNILERVLHLGDRKVSSLMTYRSEIIFLRENYSSDQIRNVVNTEFHTSYPVLDADGEPIGMVYLKDLFRDWHQKELQLKDYVKPAHFIPEGIMGYDALKKFKESKTHQAIVIDEYGQMQGVISLSDLLEALVGDVTDFYQSDYEFIEREDGSWLVDGQFPLSDLLFKFDLKDLAADYPFDTISGLILHELRHLPKAGDKLDWLNFEIEVLDLDGARIDKLSFRQKKK